MAAGASDSITRSCSVSASFMISVLLVATRLLSMASVATRLKTKMAMAMAHVNFSSMLVVSRTPIT